MTASWAGARAQLGVLALGALALGVLALGCKKEAPPATQAPPAPVNPERAVTSVKVTEVQIGKAIGTDKRVQQPLTTFATKDTIFASVTTAGTGAPAELTARWTFQDGQVVNETKRSITTSVPPGTDTNEFSIQKPDGWPAGSYKVEVLIDGKSAESKTFTVQ
jgi:hypothetical protein